jgi:hypothetical protein
MYHLGLASPYQGKEDANLPAPVIPLEEAIRRLLQHNSIASLSAVRRVACICVGVCVCVYMCVCVFVYICVYIYIYIYIYVYT